MATAADALATLNNFNSTRKTAGDAQTEAEAKYGVGDLATRVSSLRALGSNLQKSVDAVDPSVTGRTSGSLVTEAQRSALVNRERQPILGDLQKNNDSLALGQGDLTTAQSLAGQMASALIGDQNTKYQGLLDQYNAINAQETAAESKRRWEIEQANAAKAAAAASSASGWSGGGGGGGGSAPAAAAPVMTKRSDGGFNFSVGGKAISAAAYSKAAGIPIRSLLQQMANAGDRGAAVGLQLIGNDYGVNQAKLAKGFDTPFASYGANGARSIVNALLW